MTVESTSDLSDFFVTGDFGVSASYTPNGGSTATINVLFDNPFNSVPMETGERDVESNTPTALAMSSDVASVAHNDAIVISGITYAIVGVQKDSGSGYQGTTLLVLEKQ